MSTQEHSLTIERIFDAGIEEVFSAWTDPASISSWWQPGGTDIESADIDLHVGGQFRIVSTALERNVTITVSGTYKVVDKPQRLVYTWTWQDADSSLLTEDSVVSVELKQVGTQTEMTLTQQNFSSDTAKDRHFDGWQNALDSFAEYLTTKRA